MPAINVAKSDTFEIQRQKINQIGTNLFSISQGGSDLSTGLLKLGDGSRTVPSLAFTSDATLGIFKVAQNELGFVSNAKKVFDIRQNEGVFFKNAVVRKQIATTSGLVLTSQGSGYDDGVYNGVSFVGGSGAGAVGDVTVTAYTGSITNSGLGYTEGDYPDTVLTGGNGSGATADVTIDANGTVTSFDISVFDDGTSYVTGDVLSLPASLGTPTTPFAYTVGLTHTVTSVNITSGGLGYVENDTLSVNASDLTSPLLYTVTDTDTKKIQFSSTVAVAEFTEGVSVQNVGGEVLSPSLNGIYTGAASQTFAGVSLTGAAGTGLVIDFSTDSTGELQIDTVVSSGYLFTDNEIINVPAGSIGGIAGAQVNVGTVTSYTAVSVLEVYSTGGNIDSIVVEDNNQAVGGRIGAVGAAFGDTFEISAVDSATQFLIGEFDVVETNDIKYARDLTIYSGSTYRFGYSGYEADLFSFSQTPGGTFGFVDQAGVTLSTGSRVLTVTSTAGITAGMTVSIESGTGVLEAGTVVESVDNATTLTLDNLPTGDGTATLRFTGIEYTEGVFRGADYLEITVTDNTPNLYYYSQTADSYGGYAPNYSFFPQDPNNPKTFGSGLVITLDSVGSSDSVTLGIETGEVSATSFVGTSATIPTINANTSVSTQVLNAPTVNASALTSTTNLTITSATGTQVNGNFDIGSTIQVVESTGDFTTSGELKTNGSFNSSDRLTIQDNIIGSTLNNDIVLTPASSQVVKVNTNTSFQIPAGTSAERPTTLAANGAIRFNTDSGQYEGYSAATSSWSSLGGVRDIDGNTYIEAEASTGANDNILYFYNDGDNTLQLTPQKLDFISVKNISSSKTGLPAYVDFSTNTSYNLNDYVRYQKNLYQVTSAGTSGTSGAEPVHTSGAVTSGTAEFTWFAIAVDDLTFSEIDEVKIAPGSQLSVGNEIRIDANTLSTDTSDLIIQPNSGQKVQVLSTSSFAIPVGTTGQRGTPAGGSIRFNTDTSQFEGYIASSTSWSSLGGVRDVDGNTYIIPETSPGADENTLYFYNEAVNSLNVQQSSIDFNSISSINASTLNTLSINCEEVDFVSASMSIRNNTANATDSFVFTSRDNLDFGHATGLVTTPLLRLTTDGDVKINTGFGTSTSSYMTLVDKDMTMLNQRDYMVQSTEFMLTKGTTNSGTILILDPTTRSSSKLIISVFNQSSLDREVYEYLITHRNTDIFHTEYGNVNTGTPLISTEFTFDPSGDLIATIELTNDVLNAELVNIKAVSTTYRS